MNNTLTIWRTRRFWRNWREYLRGLRKLPYIIGFECDEPQNAEQTDEPLFEPESRKEKLFTLIATIGVLGLEAAVFLYGFLNM